MGLIIRQGVKQSTVHMVGVVIGALSTLFVYPYVTYAYGLGRFLIDASALLAPFVLVGLSILPIRFFPRFKNRENGHGGFLTILFGVVLLSLSCFAVLFFVGKQSVLGWIAPEDPGYRQYFNLIMPLTALTALIALLYNYTSIFGRIAIPYVFSNLVVKVLFPILLLLNLYNIIALQSFTYGLVGMLLIALIGLIFYLRSLGELKFASVDFPLLKANAREMVVYGSFGLLGTLGSVMAFKIDSVMISSLEDFQSNGVYNIGLYIANVIAAPAAAIASIAGPIVSDAWHKGDRKKIQDIYQNSSIILLVFGCVGFCVIMVCIPDLLNFFPDDVGFSNLSQVVLFLALAKLFDMATSINSQIIIYSDFYKFNLVAMLLLGVFNVITNYYLIAVMGYGIVGAAVATSLSIFLYNLIKFLFILIKLKMQPFSVGTLKLILLTIALYFILIQIPLNAHPLLNIVLKGLLAAILYFPTVYFLDISRDYTKYARLGMSYVNDFYKKMKN